MSSRRQLRRGTVALSAACALALAACGGGGESSGSSSSGSSTTSSATSQSGSPTSSASATTAPMATSLDPVAAKTALISAYGNLVKARTDKGAVAATARKSAFSGQQLKTAEAEGVMMSSLPGYHKPDAGAEKTAPLLLALSTAGSKTKTMLAEAQPAKKDLPELYVLETASDSSALRMTHVAKMLPDRRLQKYQAPVQGTPMVAETHPVGKATPRKLVDAYMAYMTYPEPHADIADQLFVADPYINGVETASRNYANQLGANGTYTMKNTLVPGSIRAFQRGDGAVLVFAHITRSEQMAVTNGASIRAPKAVTLLNPKIKTITKSVALQTDVTLAFYLPAAAGAKAELVAGSEQLLSATGS